MQSHNGYDSIYAEELAYFSEVKNFILDEISHLEKENARLFEESIDKKRQAYEEHLEYKLGPDNAVLQEELMHNQALQTTQEEELCKLKKALESPYFARLDFCFDGENESEAFYIGLLSIVDSKNYRQFVLDWRSPLASLYYDADLGSASYFANGNEISGNLDRKLQILISRSKLRRVSEIRKDLHDDMLELVLSQNSSDKMKEIVSTLQKEQNYVIRQDASSSIFIQGAAGSGKTSIALHRAAYLLYQRSDLSSRNILLISPNEYFSDYVSEVLPQLNEERAISVTFNSLACEMLSQKEERFATLKHKEASSEKLAKLFEQDFYNKFQSFIIEFKKRNFVIKDINIPGIKIKKADIKEAIERLGNVKHFSLAESLVQYFRGKFRSSSFFKLQDKIFSELWSMYQTHRLGAIYSAFCSYVDSGNFVLDKERVALPNITEALYGEKYRSFVDSQSEINGKVVKSGQSVRTLKGERSRKLTAVGSTSIDDYNKELMQEIFDDEDNSTGDFSKKVREKKSEFDYADIRIMFAAYVELYDFKMNTDVGHLIVDEFEDLGLFEHFCLAKMFPSIPKTVTGDIYQNLNVRQERDSLQFIQNIYSQYSKNLFVQEFTKAYRSSYEIATVCHKLLERSNIEAIDRKSEPVRLFYSNDFEMKIDMLIQDLEYYKNKKYGQTVVLFRSQEERLRVHERLKSKNIDTLLVPFSNQASEDSILLLTLELARGIEFDATIIFDAASSELEEDICRRELYVAASRALHGLSVYGDSGLVLELKELGSEIVNLL